jgi:Ubiquitin family
MMKCFNKNLNVSSIPLTDEQHLLYAGQTLQDSCTLQDYNIKESATINFICTRGVVQDTAFGWDNAALFVLVVFLCTRKMIRWPITDNQTVESLKVCIQAEEGIPTSEKRHTIRTL